MAVPSVWIAGSAPEEDLPMRGVVLFVAMLGLSACGDGEKTVVVQPQPAQTVVVPADQPPVVVVPEGATVICPDGTTAELSGGAYRC